MKTVIEMARETGLEWLMHNRFYEDHLQRFAELVADQEAKRIHEEGMVTVGHMREQIVAEREACAKLAEERGWYQTAAAIRARGNT